MEDMVKKAFSGVYKGKRILVTGHTGFKGSWLSFWLYLLKAEIIGYSLYKPSRPANFDALKLNNIICDIKGDIRDMDKLSFAFRRYKPDIVFHLAAQPIVGKSYDEPKTTFDTNMTGTLNVLECIRRTKSVRAAVIITSDKCYENNSWDYGYREIDRLGGIDPYSASKACAEITSFSYAKSFFPDSGSVRIATARAGNVIGGGDWAKDRIVPDCIRAWVKQRKALIRNPRSTRPWQHVLEPVSGYLWLSACLLKKGGIPSGESFNFGPDSDASYSVESLVKKMADSWGNAGWKVKQEATDRKEAALLKLCCDKALLRLGWKAALNMEDTIDYTIKWYRNFYSRSDMPKITSQQIGAYWSAAGRRGIRWAG